MNKIYLAALASLASATQILEPNFLQSDTPTKQYSDFGSTSCQFLVDGSWYSFVQTDSIATPQYFSASNTLASAEFTYCQNLGNTDASDCSNDYYASVYNKATGDCNLNSNTIALNFDENSNLVLQYSNSDTSTNGGVSQLNVTQNCDESVMNPITGELTTNDGMTYHTSQTSSQACSIFTFNALIQFVQANKFIFGPIFIGVGLFLAFLGRKLFSAAIFIVGAIIVTGFILMIFYSTFLSDNTEPWLTWLIVSLSIVVGLICGYLLMKVEKIGGALLAGWGGFILGVVLNETVFYLASSAVLFWCINVGFAVVFALLGFFFFNQAVMLATSFIGAYMTMRGIGIMAGGFPNEYVLINEIQSGAISNIDPVFYAYLAGIVVQTILCFVVQMKMFKKMQEHEQHPYNRLNA